MPQQQDRKSSQGRLLARPAQPTSGQPTTGLQPLELASPRDGLLYVPTSYHADRPAPLIVMLHGAGGNAQGSIAHFVTGAETAGCLLLVPDSRELTWDIIMDGEYGPDVHFIDRALAQTFSRYAIHPAHLALGGFSDGASYALSLGLTNGDLFSHIIAFSPGFMVPAQRRGQPRIYVSHGTHDTVLPVDRCSRRIIPRLQYEQYDVQYHEFDGPHTVPVEIALEAWTWFKGGE